MIHRPRRENAPGWPQNASLRVPTDTPPFFCTSSRFDPLWTFVRVEH